MKKLLITVVLAMSIAICIIGVNQSFDTPPVIIHTDPVPVQYVGQVKTDTVRIRLLVLKHCFESMADGDANLAIEAANLAATKGLSIQDIGNFYINQNGQANKRVEWHKCSLPQLKAFISEQMKVKAEAGDTVVVMTIGHGGPGGDLQMLGQRGPVMQAIAEAAGENQQETLWWQLSCYASAALPGIDKLTPQQQEVFSIVASADAKTESPAFVEGKIMEKLFIAMAEKSPKIDPDKDEIVTATELADFLNTIRSGRGGLVYARGPNEPIFGLSSFAWRIPIQDRNNPQGKYPRNYIPLPNQ